MDKYPLSTRSSDYLSQTTWFWFLCLTWPTLQAINKLPQPGLEFRRALCGLWGPALTLYLQELNIQFNRVYTFNRGLDGNAEKVDSLCCRTLLLVGCEQMSTYPIWPCKVRIPSKSTLVNQWVFLDYVQEYGWGVMYKIMEDSKTAASPKVHPCMGDSSRKLETWSAPHSLQAARHGGESFFQLGLSFL